MADLIISFSQQQRADGVTNLLHAEHPRINPRLTRRGIFFTHLGVDQIDEPALLDGYALALLHFAGRHADRMVVRGPVSAQFIRNAREYLEAYRCWFPENYQIPDFVAERVVDEAGVTALQAAKPVRGRAILTYSGGADSTFSLLRHGLHYLDPAGYPLEDAVLIHGYDISLAKREEFDSVAARFRTVLGRMGVRLHLVRTNLKETRVQHWGYTFMPHFAAVLHQFSGRFDYGLFASANSYSFPAAPAGSTPQIDYLTSGGLFTIVHDGAGYTRTQKIGLIANHPEAMRNLRVCWAGPRADENCGVCEKCLRTRLNFAAVGVLAPTCFAEPLSVEMIDAITVHTALQLGELEEIALFAKRNDVDGPWLEHLVARCRVLREGFTGDPNLRRSPDVTSE